MARRVEAFVTAVGFPTRLEDLYVMMQGYRAMRSGASESDLDVLLDRRGGDLDWSVPPWVQPGDVAVFYCTARMRPTIRALRRELETEGSVKGPGAARARAELDQLLDRSDANAERCAGSFVALGRVGAFPTYGRGMGTHFRDRAFAPVIDVVRLPLPLPAKEIPGFRVRPAATITQLSGETWRALVARLGRDAPRWVAGVEVGLAAAPREDWRSLVATGAFRPKTEIQFREFVATPLLRSAAGADVLAECRTFRRGKATGFIDNMACVAGEWIAVEVKLRIPSTEAVREQIRQYLGCGRAVCTLGEHKGREILVDGGPRHCWLLDGAGLYKVDAGGFVGCDAGRPFRTMRQLSGMTDRGLARLLSER